MSTTPEQVKEDGPFDLSNIPPSSHEKSSTNSTYRLIKSSENQGTVSAGGNSFVRTAFCCYSRHHNLSLTPDDVWLAICAQFSNYVNGHSKELRDRFVDFKGKKQLTVTVDGVNLHTADYTYICDQFTHQIANKLKDPSIREWIIPNFTTTTETEKMVAAVMLMSVTKAYFDYKGMLLCGLPNVTLLGEVSDWENVRERANKLLEFDLDQQYMRRWTEVLLPVLDQFIESAKGNPDLVWWNQIVNYFSVESCPSYLSCWITSFCVFDNDGKWQGEKKMKPGWCGPLEEMEWPIIDIVKIPRGYVNVPIIIDDRGVEYKTEMFAGHMSATKGKDGMTLSPSVGWALFEINERNKSQ